MDLPYSSTRVVNRELCSLWTATLKTLYTPETTFGGLRNPTEDALGVVAITQDVVTGRETMLRAFDLHFVELLHVKLVIADNAPIVCSRIHRKTRSEAAIGADDQ